MLSKDFRNHPKRIYSNVNSYKLQTLSLSVYLKGEKLNLGLLRIECVNFILSLKSYMIICFATHKQNCSRYKYIYHSHTLVKAETKYIIQSRLMSASLSVFIYFTSDFAVIFMEDT